MMLAANISDLPLFSLTWALSLSSPSVSFLSFYISVSLPISAATPDVTKRSNHNPHKS